MADGQARYDPVIAHNKQYVNPRGLTLFRPHLWEERRSCPDWSRENGCISGGSLIATPPLSSAAIVDLHLARCGVTDYPRSIPRFGSFDEELIVIAH